MNILNNFIAGQIRHLTLVPQSQISMEQPVGDPGLFGPGSLTWEVHRDFTCMMIGGIASLLLQMLHPLALSGVWDHSNFRNDMQGRLRRTSQFVGGTSFAGTPSVDWLINRVLDIHSKIQGIAPDGRPYRADDPDLLTWVHTAEVHCFLAAYLRYFNPDLPPWAQDRYYSEISVIAYRLGSSTVPSSVAEVTQYFDTMRPELEYSNRVGQVKHLLAQAKPGSVLAIPVARLFMAAAVDLLPIWAQQLLHQKTPHWHVPMIRHGVRTIAPYLRSSLRRGAYILAHHRMGLEPLLPNQPAQFPLHPPNDRSF